MIRFLRSLFGWTEFDFSAIDSRKRAQADLKNLRWASWEKRWIDGFKGRQ